MSLNCLTCQCQSLQRTDSELDTRSPKKSRRVPVERNWSGPMRSPDRDSKGRELRRGNSLEISEVPRLVRSGGMRRDWSFEDLRQYVVHSPATANNTSSSSSITQQHHTIPIN